MAPPEILVVDDEPDLRLILRLTLQVAGFGVLEASSGEEGIEVAREKAPDLMVLDLTLPGISGFEVLELMATEKALSGVPVIVMTAGVQTELRDRSLTLGARGFVAKPSSFDHLVRLIEQILDPTAAPDKS